MKKLMTLLALTLYPNIDAFSQKSPHEEVHDKIRGAKVEMIAPYEHPEARKAGERMPRPQGEIISYINMHVLNSEGVKGAKRLYGIIVGYDLNKDKISEYEFLTRYCDIRDKVTTYAIYDVPHKLLYIDSNRDRQIDSVAELDSILRVDLPMIPIKC